MLKVVTYGDEILSQKSELITEINQEIIDLTNNMFQTMYFSNGIGLAATQVGILKRLFVVDVPDGGKFVMINPKILDKSLKTSVTEEGCLSLPGIANDVVRSAEVLVEFTDIKGKTKKIEANKLLATCIQHEYDHLDGFLFIDRIQPEERLKKINEYRKLHIV